MTRRKCEPSVKPLPKGLVWPEPNEILTDDFVRLAIKKGNPAILARYLREKGGADPLVRHIADILDPASKEEFRAELTSRRGRGRPPKGKLRKSIQAAIVEQKLSPSLGKRGKQKSAIMNLSEEGGPGYSRRNIFYKLKERSR